MPFQSVPNTAEIIVRGVMGGQEIINTFYGQMTGGYTLADIEALASAVDGWVAATYKALLASNYTYVSTEVRGLNAIIDLSATNNTSAGAGTNGSSTFANNATLSVKRGTGHTGRGARGRIYLPPPPANALLDDNHVTATYVTGVQTALVALDAIISGAGWIPVMVHRVEAGVPLAVAVVFTVIEWIVVDNVIDSMRRRLPGRGV